MFSLLMIYAASRTSNTVLETLRLKYHNAQLVDQLASQLEKGEQTALLLNVHSEHYRFIVEYAQDIIYRSGRFTFINPAVIRLLRHHETEMLGHRALYESSPEMLLTVDAKCTLLTFNATAAAELGYEADSLIGQPVSLIVHADDQARMQHFDDCLARPGSVLRGELRTIRKDASHLWVREAARAVRNPDGRLDIVMSAKT